MFKDIITYQLADNVSEQHLFKVADEVFKTWMKQQSGFLKWEIHSNSDGSYTDIVYWESKEHAQKAETDMGNIPNVKDWQACYKPGSISSHHLSQLASFK